MSAKSEISVLLPVHNAARFLPEALTSLAAQTCRKFEVVAVDDGSTDGSLEELKKFALHHDWLRVLSQEKAGVAVALNHAFAASVGEFVARMDADDVAAPGRLQIQAEFLRAHPQIGVCGSWVRAFGQGRPSVIRTPITDDAVRSWLIFGSAFVHPAVMMRRGVLDRLDRPYEVGAPPLEDYTLWLALSGFTQFHNLPEVLLHYRHHSGQVTRHKSPAFDEKLLRLRMGLLNELGLVCTAAEQRAHAALGFEGFGGERPQPHEVAAWLERLHQAVPASGWCSEKALRADASNAWWRYMRSGPGGISEALVYGRAQVVKRTPRTLFRMARLALR